MAYASFPTQPKTAWTQIPSGISSTLRTGHLPCTKHERLYVRKLVLLFHRNSVDDDFVLVLALQQSNKTKITSNRVDELITHVHEGWSQ